MRSVLREGLSAVHSGGYDRWKRHGPRGSDRRARRPNPTTSACWITRASRTSYLSDMKAVVLIAQGNSYPVNTKSADIKNLRDKYAPQSVAFLMINSNVPESRDQVAAAAEKQGIDLPILIDETQLIGESLGLRNNGEVLIVDPRDWTLAYRGDAQNTAAALDAVLAGTPVTRRARVRGCEVPEAARRTARPDLL